MNEDTQSSADYKLDKNGRKYPARRIKTSKDSEVTEAYYPGNIGIMELTKFHSSASPSDKKIFVGLMNKRNESKSDKETREITNQIWNHVQKVTGSKLHQMENTILSFRSLYEGSADHVLQVLANKDINASFKNGDVHIHDHSQHKKAKDIVKRMGLSYNVVKAEDDQGKRNIKESEEYTLEDLLEAWEVKKFNQLVHGYLKHKKAAKVGGFKAMDFHRYADTVEKVLRHPKTSSGSVEENSIKLELPKPRDPNHVILKAKLRASGKHKDKKRELKQGNSKHKNRPDTDFL